MKYKSTLNVIGKTIFLLCFLTLIIHYFSNIKISFHHYLFHFWGIYLISFLILILTSTRKVYFMFTGIIPIMSSIYHFINIDHRIGFRTKISNSQYEITAYSHNYQVMERFYFIEKVVAGKKSDIFFNPNSKIGLINSFDLEVKLLNDSKKLITIEIKTIRNGKAIDTLKKEQFINIGY